MIPRELIDQVAEGTYIGTCDWGWCNRPTAGFGRHGIGDGDWYAICDECAHGRFPAENTAPLSVDAFYPLGDLGEDWWS